MTAYGDLNANERRVLAGLGIVPATLRHLAWLCFPELPPEKAYSWVRNSVRRPLRLKLIRHVGQGTYGLTANGVACLFAAGDEPRKVRLAFRREGTAASRPPTRKRAG